MKIFLKNSAVKGYHIFKITPFKKMTMIVEREEEMNLIHMLWSAIDSLQIT